MPDGTRSDNAAAPIQREARLCPYCAAFFAPKRLRQDFCSDSHRIAYHRDVGTEGVVASVTRLKRGVSVVTHYPDGPSAERAIGLRKGQAVRVVAK